MHTLKLIRCWSTFWFDYTTLDYTTLFWVYQHGTSLLGNICPLFFTKMLHICQRARASPVHSPLQVTPQIFNRFRAGLWLGHSKTLSSSGEAILLLILMYALGCCRSERWSSSSSSAIYKEAWRFCSNIDWYLELFIIPSTLTKAPIPAEEKQPQSVMLPPPCFTVGMVFFWWCAVLFLCQTYHLELWPKSSTLVPSDQNISPHAFERLMCFC